METEIVECTAGYTDGSTGGCIGRCSDGYTGGSMAGKQYSGMGVGAESTHCN